jgi:hypothetical protein
MQTNMNKQGEVTPHDFVSNDLLLLSVFFGLVKTFEFQLTLTLPVTYGNSR